MLQTEWETSCPRCLCYKDVCRCHQINDGKSNTLDKKVEGVKYDQGKPRLSLPLVETPYAFQELGTMLTFGADKYGVGNWLKVPNKEERYLDALMRHLSSHCRGNKLDDESGKLHLAHAAVNLMFLLELELRNEHI